MSKTLMTILLFIIAFRSLGQEQTIYYKKIADDLIQKHFDSSLITVIKCDSFTETYSEPNSVYGQIGTYQYEKYKLERWRFTVLTFHYSFYSPAIRDTFCFDLRMNNKAKALYDARLFDDIPSCIRNNEDCKFIPKESAINIAIKDRIKYNDNLQVQLEQSPKSKLFYWIVSGQSKQTSSSDNEQTDYRYIDIKNGEIISKAKFYGLK